MSLLWNDMIHLIKTFEPVYDEASIDIISRNGINNVLPDKFNNIHKIDDYAFYKYTNLALTSLPEGLTSIGNSAFFGCINLALTSLPEGVANIGDNAFEGCVSLRTITFRSMPIYIA